MPHDLVIRVSRTTHPATLARRTLEARREGRGTVWVAPTRSVSATSSRSGSRSASEIFAATTALVGADAPDAIQFRATLADGHDQVIRWLAPGERPGPESMTFAYPTGASSGQPKVPRSARTRAKS
jgi:hypothetical protein